MPAAAAEIRTGFLFYRNLPLSLNVIGAICNAAAEEIGFRGYAIERLTEITGSLWLAAGIPYVVEVLCHAPVWGGYGMLMQAPRLLIFVLLYCWLRSLPANTFAHLLSDIIPIFW